MVHRIALILILMLSPLAGWTQSAVLPVDTASEDTGPTPTETLIEMLEDDDARAALIERLKGGGTVAETATDTNEDVLETTTDSFGRRLAVSTKSAAEAAAASVQRIWLGLVKLPPTLASLGGVASSDVLGLAVRDLGFVIVATYALLLILRYGARRIYRRIGQAAAESGWVKTTGLSVSSNLIAIFAIIGAWALGYVVMLIFSGGVGLVGIRQSLYLNAFLAVELSKMLVRAILSPMVPELRLVTLSNAAARSLSRWLSTAISILGYGHLLAVPILNQSIGYLSGSALGTVISLIIILMATYYVITQSAKVTSWLVKDQQEAGVYRLRDVLAGLWQVPVLLYLAVLFVIVATRPGDILFAIMLGSGRVALTLVVVMIVISILGRVLTGGVSLPKVVSRQLPALENRLNAIAPVLLSVARVIGGIVVLFVALDAVGLSGVLGWIGLTDASAFWATILSVVLLLLGIFVAWLIFASWVDYRLSPDLGSVPSARETTLLTLLRNAMTIAFIVFTAMFVLSELGINIAPLIASAGVLGLAIGFGAQKFVQDIITGIFIQFENAINVGDYITVGGVSGTVEQLTIRSVSLRDPEGAFHIIPFSSVDLVTNYAREFGYSICDMGVGYGENIEVVKQAMFDAFDVMMKDEDVAENIIGELEWFGLQSFGDSAIVLRARIKTRAGYQWGVGRAYNGALKPIFDERGIEIPFPHQTIYFGEDKDGNAPALNVRRLEPDAG